MRTTCLLALLALAVAAPAPACGPTAVCGDVGASLVGQVLDNGFRVAWATDDEDASVWGYKVRRYAGDPSGAVLVTTVPKVSSCSVSQTYAIEDDPGAGSWTYVVEVWTAVGTRSCAFDVVPQ